MKKTIYFTKAIIFIICLLGFSSNDIKAQCQAQFTYTIAPNGVVYFESTSTGVTQNTNYLYSFGANGTWNPGANTMNTYMQNGTYNVQLTISDSLTSCYSTYTTNINITNVPCNISPDFNWDLGPNGTAIFYSYSSLVSTNTLSTVYNWDLGDGHSSNATYSVSNTYSASGIYTVSLNIIDTSSTGCSGTTTHTIDVMISNCNLQSNFSYSIAPNGTVYFESLSTGVSQTTNFYYNFGDNSGLEAGPNSSHVYHQNGIYSVQLVITDSVNFCTDTYTANINITNIPCNIIADFNWQLEQNGLVNFNNTSTTVSTNTTTTIYNWNFGDGHSSHSPYSVSNTYSASGIYTVSLNITDTSATGCSGSVTQTINVIVSNCNLQSNYSYSVGANNQVVFQNLSSNTTSSTTYQWNFGNGTYSSVINPTVTYAPNSGTVAPYYAVTLTVYDSSGVVTCSDSYTENVYLNTTCNASFNATQLGPKCWQFNNYSTGTMLNYYWNFGDGMTSNLNNPQHCYSDSSDQHTVSLVITSPSNCSDTTYVVINDTMTYNPSGCDAQFTYWIDTTNCLLHLNNLSSNSTSYLWTINNGSYSFTSNQTDPVVSFTTSASLNVSLYSYYAGQICDTVQHSIFVPAHCSTNPNGTSCHASFVLYQDSTNASHYYAYNQSVGTNLSYLWDFGDGTTSNQPYPSHTYSNAGNYVICLTVSNSNCSSSYCDSNNVFRVSASNLMQSITVVPSNATSVNNVKEDIKLELFPNPASSVIIITSDSELNEIKVFDISGKQVFLDKNVNQPEYNLSVNNLDSGCYIIEITAKDGMRVTKKVMKL